MGGVAKRASTYRPCDWPEPGVQRLCPVGITPVRMCRAKEKFARHCVHPIGSRELGGSQRQLSLRFSCDLFTTLVANYPFNSTSGWTQPYKYLMLIYFRDSIKMCISLVCNTVKYNRYKYCIYHYSFAKYHKLRPKIKLRWKIKKVSINVIWNRLIDNFWRIYY